MNRWIAALAAVMAVAGCNANGTTTAISIKSKDTTALKTRTVNFQVFAPASMADSSGKIINADPNGIVASGAGNIVASGAGNIVASGAGNLRAPTFRLAEALTGFVAVQSADVQLFDLDDKPVGKLTVLSRADGTATLNGVPDGKPLVAVARWKLKDKISRTSAVVGLGDAGAVMLDPINRFVEARVRDILAKSGKATKVDPAKLKAVWTAFNKANIALDSTLLSDDANASDLIDFYKQQVAKLPCDDQKLVKNYMVDLGADSTPVTCN